MRSRQLECFVRVCELGSITKAAATLNIAQPALGIQIKSLEREFGVQLLERTVAGTKPTAAGLIFLDEAKYILSRLQNLRKTLQEATGSAPRSLTLGLTPSLTGLLASRLLEYARQAMPALTLTIMEDLSHTLIDHAENGKLDLALAFSAPNNPVLHGAPSLREALYLITAPGSRFAEDAPIRLRDIAEADLTMPSEGDFVRGAMEKAMRAHGLTLRVAYPVDSMPAIKAVAERGLACGILPFSAVAREVAAGTLVARPIIEPSIKRTLYVIRPADRPPNDTAERVSAIITGLLRDLCAENTAFELIR